MSNVVDIGKLKGNRLAEALRACGCKAARTVVDEVERQLAEG